MSNYRSVYQDRSRRNGMILEKFTITSMVVRLFKQVHSTSHNSHRTVDIGAPVSRCVIVGSEQGSFRIVAMAGFVLLRLRAVVVIPDMYRGSSFRMRSQENPG